MTLDVYGHLFGDRLDTVAEAMDALRTASIVAPASASTSSAVLNLDRAREAADRR